MRAHLALSHDLRWLKQRTVRYVENAKRNWAFRRAPDPADDFGLNLGASTPRGERNVLVASLDSLLRVGSNPFVPYMIARIEEGIIGTSANSAMDASTATTGHLVREEAPAWGLAALFRFFSSLMQDQTDPSEPP